MSLGPGTRGCGMTDANSDLKAAFDKVHRFLHSDLEQNRSLPASFRSDIDRGEDCDALTNAHGDFGRCATNPIPVNGPIGEVLYLSRLRTANGSALMFHRLGTDSFTKPIDKFEVMSLDGQVREVLYLSMYHPRKTKKVPAGYRYAPDFDPSNILYGVDYYVDDFPQGLDAQVRKWEMETLGVPLPVRKIREAINGSSFTPSSPGSSEAASRLRAEILRKAVAQVREASVQPALQEFHLGQPVSASAGQSPRHSAVAYVFVIIRLFAFLLFIGGIWLLITYAPTISSPFLPSTAIALVAVCFYVSRFENQRWMRRRTQGIQGSSLIAGFIVDFTYGVCLLFSILYLVAFIWQFGWQPTVGLVTINLVMGMIWSLATRDSLVVWILATIAAWPLMFVLGSTVSWFGLLELEVPLLQVLQSTP